LYTEPVRQEHFFFLQKWCFTKSNLTNIKYISFLFLNILTLNYQKCGVFSQSNKHKLLIACRIRLGLDLNETPGQKQKKLLILESISCENECIIMISSFMLQSPKVSEQKQCINGIERLEVNFLMTVWESVLSNGSGDYSSLSVTNQTFKLYPRSSKGIVQKLQLIL